MHLLYNDFNLDDMDCTLLKLHKIPAASNIEASVDFNVRSLRLMETINKELGT